MDKHWPLSNGISHFDPFHVTFCRRGTTRLSCNREFVEMCRIELMLAKSKNAGDLGAVFISSSSEAWPI
jgi:hypothetical protein